MTREQARNILTIAGYTLTFENKIPYGYQIHTACGAVISVWNKGTYYVQGKNPKAAKAALGKGMSQRFRQSISSY